MNVDDNNQKLYSEPKEEEEIELEERNINLVNHGQHLSHSVSLRRNTYLKSQISPLHSQICADVLVDGPCKFVV